MDTKWHIVQSLLKYKKIHGKFVGIVQVQPIIETQIVTTYVNVVDVNVTTNNKITKKQKFKNNKPRKTKNVVDWEKEKWLKKLMVETLTATFLWQPVTYFLKGYQMVYLIMFCSRRNTTKPFQGSSLLV